MPVYTLRYVVFGTRPFKLHEWTEHQGAPWQRAFSSRNHGGVRSIHPRDLYMLTQLLNHVSKEQCSRGEYTKKRSPGQSKFIDGGLFGSLNGAGAWTGAGAGVKKKTPRPGLLTGAGRGIDAGARRFRGPGGPITNTIRGIGLSALDRPLPLGLWCWSNRNNSRSISALCS